MTLCLASHISFAKYLEKVQMVPQHELPEDLPESELYVTQYILPGGAATKLISKISFRLELSGDFCTGLGFYLHSNPSSQARI